ncbi:Potassium voltage-gated channel sub G member 1 [Phytophthora pseudosyringae]|uniref:Potassium voltage-gated channel sub G member 1 n=1 Tax=Phytophthora pseudosyringae TaxID=221518 RepID=A0A8T1W6Q7_9STRA|nr:Potassium voltage-gated channel sub G member 1 [Phytophthora pseudosyringae]
MELSDTALKLSKVIEREAKRRSALHSSRLFHVQAHLPSFSRPKTDKAQRSQRSRRSMSVAPTPEEDSILTTVEGSNPELPVSKGAKVTLTRQGSRTASDSQAEDSGEPVGCMQKLWVFFEDPQSSTPAYYFSLGIYGFIILSTFVFVAETEAVFVPYMVGLTTLEALCAGVFSFELIGRFLVCPSKLVFLRVFPFYMESLLAVDNAGSFGAIRIVRLTRVARVLKMSRYSSAIQVFTQAISISIKPLTMLIFLMSIAMIIFSSAIYFAEFTNDGCRADGWMGNCDVGSSGDVNTTDVVYSVSAAAAVASVRTSEACVCVDPNPYQGIATSFWWCIVTMSTVGYGDMTPVTWMGKVVGCCTVLTGMLVLALPITVIGTNFQKVMKSVMHETMKSNVDFLKGKRMICRNEIEGILERFHAVTEGIHLDIDDVINVYDTDNSGMLEDDELAKFRNDLEVLQNRAFMNQLVVPGVGLHQHRPPTTNGRRRSGSTTAIQSPTELLLQNKAMRTESMGHRRPSVSIALRPSTAVVGLGAPDTKSTDHIAVLDSSPQQSGPSADAAGLNGVSAQTKLSSSSSSSHLVMPDNELLLRLLDMQESFQERLLETEQRLEAKLNNLTKILMRLEGMMELDD